MYIIINIDREPVFTSFSFDTAWEFHPFPGWKGPAQVGRRSQKAFEIWPACGVLYRREWWTCHCRLWWTACGDLLERFERGHQGLHLVSHDFCSIWRLSNDAWASLEYAWKIVYIASLWQEPKKEFQGSNAAIHKVHSNATVWSASSYGYDLVFYNMITTWYNMRYA